VRLAVNLPDRYKARFSPAVRDPDHPFYRDKWVVRTIADRYIPRSLSQRMKRPFPTNASERIQVADAFFEGSFVQDWFGLSRARLRYLLANASHTLLLRLLHLDAWGQQCLSIGPTTSLPQRLADHVSVRAAS
jgi:asparagine synthase (glutamine-hydrolysing)